MVLMLFVSWYGVLMYRQAMHPMTRGDSGPSSTTSEGGGIGAS